MSQSKEEILKEEAEKEKQLSKRDRERLQEADEKIARADRSLGEKRKDE